ncbi:DEDD exonuclease domain-containing protein [Ornithinimicrobium cryptoxanthini]|uniref:DEDD exonuclease domain-containing protein n=1 Tax=Ornithinimicrobium cryptoxanthini TaxID=2934161 RepID=A0ABY4YLQ6_9MICO|nr:DEDD exonuclease domain-containing protein [Ornithinimicrobium cryptoxanthini]USQ77552.1 DEDD exonuclease domain-containing protein [Ornithinimicrobium cryptoxanthini]
MQMVQETFDDLGVHLSDVTFVVVDLETTGGSPADCGITEIGAVKVRGGEVIGEFQTLVRPSVPIPAFITVLTGISNAMVAEAPRIDSALPAFLEFARGSVLVAHNAGFDVSFLKAAAASTGHVWPGFAVLDTVRLARQLVHRDETPNHKLSSLARLFGATTTPDHRALHDARATVDVLHGLIERVGNLGVHTLEELQSYTSRVSTAQRRKRFLADEMPSAPGVYVFKDGRGEPLYVGTAVDIRRRTRTYFTASETRRRMAEMVGIAESITPIVCATRLEAQVRELRLIAEYKPRYNRRSRHPEKALWVKLTAEPFPRLSIVRQVRGDGAHYAGPFASRKTAEAAVTAVHEVIPLRQCTQTLTERSRKSACVLFEIGRCGAPCIGEQTTEEYAALAGQAAMALVGDGRDVLAALRGRLDSLAAQERFEDATTLRDRMIALVRASARAQRLAPLSSAPEVVAARRRDAGGWEVVCVRFGRLAGSTVTPRGADPMPFIDAVRATAEVVSGPTAPAPAAHPEETELVLRWLEAPGTRLVTMEGEWTCPVGGAGAARAELEPMARQWGEFAEPWGETPAVRPLERPPGALRVGLA